MKRLGNFSSNDEVGYNAAMNRRLQFSLSWLVILMLVIGAFFGGVSVGRRCHELENQRAKEELASERERLGLDRMRMRLHNPSDFYYGQPW